MRGITAQPAGDLKFLLTGKDGKQDKMVTIPEYYKQVHNVTVTKPRLVRSSSLRSTSCCALMTSLASLSVSETTSRASSLTINFPSII